MNSGITFQGWKREYHISDPARLRKAIDDVLEKNQAEVKGEMVMGAAISYLTSCLRDSGFSMPGLEVDQETMYEALGYKTAHGKTGRNTRGGFKYCTPAKVVTI